MLGNGRNVTQAVLRCQPADCKNYEEEELGEHHDSRARKTPRIKESIAQRSREVTEGRLAVGRRKVLWWRVAENTSVKAGKLMDDQWTISKRQTRLQLHVDSLRTCRKCPKMQSNRFPAARFQAG